MPWPLFCVPCGLPVPLPLPHLPSGNSNQIILSWQHQEGNVVNRPQKRQEKWVSSPHASLNNRNICHIHTQPLFHRHSENSAWGILWHSGSMDWCRRPMFWTFLPTNVCPSILGYNSNYPCCCHQWSAFGWVNELVWAQLPLCTRWGRWDKW